MRIDAMNKVRVAVIMGGVSSEHDISLKSGSTVLDNLPRSRFIRRGVVIQRNGLWRVGREECGLENPSTLRPGITPEMALIELKEWGTDVAFLALHGPNGEDGSIQGFFQTAGVFYTGPGIETCALSINKYKSKLIAARTGVRTPPGALLTRNEWTRHRGRFLSGIEERLGFPVFVKPVRLGSSIGITRVEEPSSLSDAIMTGFTFDDDLIVEKEIAGREITCAVIGNPESGLKALPAVEICPRGNRFFDFESKYDPDKADEICPAVICKEDQETIENTSISIYKCFGARGFSRLDFILDDVGFWFLELNAIPGLTGESILLKEAEAAGIDLSTLMETIADLGMGKPLSESFNLNA